MEGEKLRDKLRLVGVGIGLFVLSGCSTNLYNLTPESMPENPSGIYTFRMEAKPVRWDPAEQDVEATITIDGQTFPMQQSRRDPGVFEFDYKFPAGETAAKFYYTLDYSSFKGDKVKERVLQSADIHYTRLTNRYVIGLESDRGPVGAEIFVLGRNFSPADQIIMGGTELPVKFYSAASVSFQVPPLPSGQTYDVIIRSGEADLYYGGFRVDPSSFTVTPRSINIASGETTPMLFSLPSPAPEGGLSIFVTTNIPESIVMPEIFISEGQQSINVFVEGALPGSGVLRVETPGFDIIEIPVNIR